VPANVVVGREVPLPGSGDKDALTGYIADQVIAGTGQLLLAPDTEPLSEKDPFSLSPEMLKVNVGRSRKRRFHGFAG